MRRIKEQLLKKTAKLIHKAALRGAGRASECGVYQPQRPENLKKDLW